jgi:hypothetical protein
MADVRGTERKPRQAEARETQVRDNYMRESDPRMPKLNESSTRISFGQGRKPD